MVMTSGFPRGGSRIAVERCAEYGDISHFAESMQLCRLGRGELGIQRGVDSGFLQKFAVQLKPCKGPVKPVSHPERIMKFAFLVHPISADTAALLQFDQS